MTNKVYTYYENINFKHQDRLIELWKNSWLSNGFDPIVLFRKDAEAHPLFSDFVDKIHSLHLKIANIPLDKYGLSCWLRWLAYSRIQCDDKFYVCDYDIINHSLKPKLANDDDSFLYLLDGDCPCIARGYSYQFSKLCSDFIEITENNTNEFAWWYQQLKFKKYHDQEFFILAQKLEKDIGVKYSRNRAKFLGIPNEGEFWKKQIVHYGHNLCHGLCVSRGTNFDEEARCNIIEEHLKYGN